MLPKKLFFAQGYDWDSGNLEKNSLKHGVSPLECEEVFFNQPLIVLPDVTHSSQEERFYALGRTHLDRHLFIAFTMRGKKIRVILARDMSTKERKVYGT